MKVKLETRCGCTRTIDLPFAFGSSPPPTVILPLAIRENLAVNVFGKDDVVPLDWPTVREFYLHDYSFDETGWPSYLYKEE